jgi:hypothetical protein
LDEERQENSPPKADAGQNQEKIAGNKETVILDGRGSMNIDGVCNVFCFYITKSTKPVSKSIFQKSRNFEFYICIR